MNIVRLKRLIEDGHFTSVVEEIGKEPCQTQARIVALDGGGYYYGLALLRLSLVKELNELIESLTSFDPYRANKLRCSLELTRSPKNASTLLDALLNDDPGEIMGDDVFLWAVLNAGLGSRIEKYVRYIPDEKMRSLVEGILKEGSSSEKSFNTNFDDLGLTSAASLLLAASLLIDSKEYDPAQRLIDKALVLHPNHADALAFKEFVCFQLTKRAAPTDMQSVKAAGGWNHALATQLLRTNLRSNKFGKSFQISLVELRLTLSLGATARKTLQCISNAKVDG